MRNWLVGFIGGAMQSAEVANHPFPFVLSPVKRRLPMFRVYLFPTGRVPPTKISVAFRLNELEIFADTNRCSIDREIFKPHFVRGLFIVPGERGTRILRLSHGRHAQATSVPQLKQSTVDLDHSIDARNRFRCGSERRLKLIAQQMLDVIDEQLLMLHLVLETKPDDSQEFVSIVTIRKLLDKSHHLLVDVRAILPGFSDCWSRTRAALWTLDSWPEALVVRVEEEQKVFAVSLVSRLKLLEYRLEKPRGVANVPAGR